jgi:hypothetical protein
MRLFKNLCDTDDFRGNALYQIGMVFCSECEVLLETSKARCLTIKTVDAKRLGLMVGDVLTIRIDKDSQKQE